MKIFVARLPYQFKEADIAELFAPYGEVSAVNLIMDRETGRSKCFAFVEMPDDDQANAAIAGLNEKQILDKAIAVSQAKEKERIERPAGGGYRGGSGSGGGYRGGNSGGGSNYRDSGNSGGGYRGGNDRGSYRDKGDSGGNYRDRGNSGGNRDYKSKGGSDDY
ncbi:MAG: RNA-binding protein [Mucilaginibacter sp.]